MKALEVGKRFVEQNATTILTGIGMAGVVVTAAATTKATIKAVKVLDGTESKKDVVKKTWKYYIPPVIIGGGTIACIFMANKISLEKIAAATTMYKLSEGKFDQYKQKAKMIFGEKGDEEVKDLVAKDDVEHTPFSQAVPIELGDEDTLCFDSLSGRYFKNSIDQIKRVVNDLNESIVKGDWVSINDLYYGWGLGGVSWGDEYGWNPYSYEDAWGQESMLIKPRYSSQLTDTGRPCFVIQLGGLYPME